MNYRPVPSMVPVASTGLQEEAPLTIDSDEFEDSPTTLDIRRATSTTPLYGRLTGRVQDAGDAGFPEWTDYVFESKFKIVNSNAEFLVRARGPENFYLFNLREFTDPDTIQILPRVDGSWQFDEIVETEIEGTLSEGTWHEVRIEVVGNEFDCYVDGMHLIHYVDDTHSDGTVGFRTARNDHALYDDLVVTDTSGDVLLEEDLEDETDGSTPEDFTGGVITDGTLEMQPQTYEVFYSPSVASGVRLKFTGPDGSNAVYSSAVEPPQHNGIRSTGWTRIPPQMNGGNVVLQGANVRVTAVTVELAIRNQV